MLCKKCGYVFDDPMDKRPAIPYIRYFSLPGYMHPDGYREDIRITCDI